MPFGTPQPVSLIINGASPRHKALESSTPNTSIVLCSSDSVLSLTLLTGGPHYIELFNQISLHICNLIPSGSAEPANKKRRIDDQSLAARPASRGTNGHVTSNGAATAVSAPASVDDPVLLEVKEISVVIPQRKKYTLCFTSTHLYARLPDSKEPIAGISFAWSEIGMFNQYTISSSTK